MNSLRPPTSAELNLLAKHREEPPSEEGSSADEGVPSKGSGWCGLREPLSVGVGCAGRTVTAKALRHPDDGQWKAGSIQSQSNGRAL